jgi:hypothetical protein
VLSGETKKEDIPASPHQPTYVFENIGEMAAWLNDHA